MSVSRALTPLVAVLSLACSIIHRGTAVPRIDAVLPDSVAVPSGAVVEVVVRGRGFTPGTPGRNTVQFGTITLTDVPASDDGTQIRFVIPGVVPSRGEAAPVPLESGEYPVRIQTATGSSNAVILRVYR